ncbi:hypothetical protein A7K93_02450 [Candidatus Methylacidiphilum fumarolicum]|nr:TonB-dependent receptor [Candidatus Methylacidiphilum fumarolicum]TFE68352.1 hypothetical protein A7K73_00755 [Candidatus Methylacidiphilum fumarolicum]TFE73576.1 hypothetical protein A7K72_06395 [Candidatus Methylacidiphilum fumarolicum]TFE75054.1 hypothetical protein A7K93_02450 [Candidatus Methylacidiphilum fumarolicum]TFE76600.1 hypothetical protein A7D33_09455 [Candidatus Methylacidiphilum fumarolicum]
MKGEGDSVLPTASPTSSVFGFPMEVLDIPRQVTPINQTLMKSAGVTALGYLDPVSIAMLIPGAYSGLNGGFGTAPTVRGFAATPYVNGIQDTLQHFSFGGVPWNWNMVESMDLTEGPANAVFGATQPSSGSVNYLTKQPYFDRFRGSVWDSTGMYQNYMWGTDFGGPIGKSGKAGYRLSYMGIENGSYYQNIHNDQQNIYLAIGLKPTENYSVNFYGDLGTYDYMPLMGMGINRPTSALINDGLYSTGFLPIQEVTSGPAHNPPFSTYAGPLKPISRRLSTVNPEGGGRGLSGLLQLVQQVQLSDQAQLVNNTAFFYDQNAFLLPSRFYDQSIPGDYEVDNRTEIRIGFDTPIWGKAENEKEAFNITHQVDLGVEWSFERNLDYVSQSFSVLNAWDILQTNPLMWNAELTPAFQARVRNPKAPSGGLWPVPGGAAGYYFEPLNGGGGSTDSQFWALSPFYQHNFTFGEHWSLLLGARVTGYFVSATTPPGTPAVLSTGYETAQLAPLFNISPVYKPFPWMTAYFDFNWYYATAEDGAQGGYTPASTAGNSFRIENRLYEGGVKFSLLGDKLYLSTAGFAERTSLFNFLAPPTPADVTGFELSATYQPNRHWWARLGYFYAQGTENWSALSHGPFMFGQQYNTDLVLALGLPLDSTKPFPPGVYNFISWPNSVLNAMVTYTTDFGVGLTVGLLAMSSQFLDYNYAVSIPGQYVANVRLFYANSSWEASIMFFNVTDSHYWLPMGSGASPARGFDTTSIMAGLPFWIQGTLAWKF